MASTLVVADVYAFMRARIVEGFLTDADSTWSNVMADAPPARGIT
jgi:hypothetical protein